MTNGGAYRFDAIGAGAYDLTVTKADCVTAKMHVTLTNEPVWCDVTLRLTGDVDGALSINDATMLQRHLAEFTNADGTPVIGEEDTQTRAAADLNGDGVLSVSDVTELQRFLAR